jgi:hypothetical protein
MNTFVVNTFVVVVVMLAYTFVAAVVMFALTGPVSASDDRGPKVSCVLLSVSLSQLALSSLSLSL